MKEQEVTLTEAELSDVKNSIATLCKKYIAGSFFDKLVDSSGIKIAKDILMSDLKEMIGHGTSAPAAKKFATAILTAKSTPAVDTWAPRWPSSIRTKVGVPSGAVLSIKSSRPLPS